MYLVKFTYFTYCQGAQDRNQTTVLVADADNFQQACEAIELSFRWSEAHDFEDMTLNVVKDERAAEDDAERELEAQQEFIDWLKSEKIYDKKASAREMAMMFDVWKRLGLCCDCGKNVAHSDDAQESGRRRLMTTTWECKKCGGKGCFGGRDGTKLYCNNCGRDVTRQIEKCKPKCGNDGTKWNRNECEYDEAGNCIHCGEGIPF